MLIVLNEQFSKDGHCRYTIGCIVMVHSEESIYDRYFSLGGKSIYHRYFQLSFYEI